MQPSEPNASVPPAEVFLNIEVTDPMKQGDGVQAHVSYKVSYKTNLASFRWANYHVIRRFTDFVWLHDRLADQNKGIIVPPLPEKNVVEKFRFSADFIEVRRRALDIFLNRVAAHPLLRMSDSLMLFLQADNDAWSIETSRSSDSTIFKTSPRDFYQMFKDVGTSLSSAVMGGEKVEEEEDPEHESAKKYILTLEEHLMEAQRHSFRLVKRQKELGLALAAFGEAVKALGQCEGGSLGKAFAELAKRSDILALKSQKQASDLLLNFEEPLKEYVRMTLSVKVAMHDKAMASKQVAELRADVENKRGRLSKLEQATPSKPEKIQELKRDMEETECKVDAAKTTFDVLAKRLRVEFVRFQEEKTKDLGVILHSFAKGQAELAKDAASTWATLLPTLNATKAQYA